MAFTRDQDDGINETAPPSSSSSPFPREIPVPDDDRLRRFSRSPHPYHRKGSRLLEQPGEFPPAVNGNIYGQTPIWMTAPRTSSDSGTEADDESTGFLKGLPAPPVRPRKGLRTSAVGATTSEDPASWLVDSLPWSLFVRSPSRSSRGSSGEESHRGSVLRREATARKRCKEVLRRLGETALLVFTGAVVFLRDDVRLLALSWHRGTISKIWVAHI